VFEGVGAAELKYLGTARCVEFWPDTGLDRLGQRRRIFRFRLRFETARRSAQRAARNTPGKSAPAGRVSRSRRPRPFDPSQRPTPAAPPDVKATPEEAAAEREKATQSHHDAVSQLAEIVTAAGWTEPQEIRLAIDLYSAPRGRRLRRVLFEVKTLRSGGELRQTRAALAQLLEYRLLYGEPDDDLCLVTTAPVSEERARLLRALGVDVAWIDHGAVMTTGVCTSRSVDSLLGPT
jgi:hypothetical protein